MALEYDLYLTSDIDAERLLQIVEDSLGLDHLRDPEFRSQHSPSLVGRVAPGFILTAHAVSPMSAEITEEWLGIRPNVSVGFRIASLEEDREGAYQRLLHATSEMLSRLPGDAALVFNGDFGILIRRDSRVTLTDAPTMFSPERLAQIRVPYELGKVPNCTGTS